MAETGYNNRPPTPTLPVNGRKEEFSPVLDRPSAMTRVVEKIRQVGEDMSGGARVVG